MNEKEQYELMVKELLTTNLPFKNIRNIELHHRKKYKAKSGAEHEMDVSYEIETEIGNFLIVAECKELKKKVTKKDMIDFAFKISDISAHKGFFITTNGFESGAIEIAKSERIALLLAKDRMHTLLQGDIPEPFLKEELFQLFPSFKKLDDQTLDFFLKTVHPVSEFEEFGTGKSKESVGYKFEAHTYNFTSLPNHTVSIENALEMIFLDAILNIKDNKEKFDQE